MSRRAAAPMKNAACAGLIMAFASDTLLAQATDRSDDGSQHSPPQSGWQTIIGEAEFGLGYVSDDSFRFGRYNGLEDQGVFLIGHLDWLLRHDPETDGRDYILIQGRDLGLATRELAFEAGRQNAYSVRLEHDRQRSRFERYAVTPFVQTSDTNFVLPDNWVAAGNTAGLETLRSSLRFVNFQRSRDRTSLQLEGFWNNSWKLSTRLMNESRDGSTPVAATIGTDGGNPRAVFLPAPTNFDTRTIEAMLSYAKPGRQFNLAYHASIFENDDLGVTWENPFTIQPRWDPAAAFPTGVGQISRPPDNQFHQLRATSALQISPKIRFSGDLAIGRMRQDDDFLPYTINPILAETVTEPLPRSSLDGRIDTTALNLVMNMRPFRRLNMNLRFRIDDRDNQTDQDQFVTLRGDAEAQNTAQASNRRRFNRPFDYQEQTVKLDARYRLGMRSRLFGSIERKRIKRRFSERERVVDNRATLGWARALGTKWNVQLDGEISDRTGSTFNGEIALAEGFTPEYAATVPGGFINLPGLRHFHLADRRRYLGRARVNFVPAQAWSVGLEAAFSNDEYGDTERQPDLGLIERELGLVKSTTDSITGELSFTPSEQWTAHAFARIERMTFDQDGQSFRGFIKLPDAANPERRWLADQSDRVQSFGTGLNWRPSDRNIELDADYVLVRSRARIDVQTGADIPSAPLPSVDSSLHSVRLRGHWHVTQTTSIGLSWWFERFRSDQFALDNVAVDQLANIILPGETSPDYQVHVVSLSLRYRF